MTQIDTEGDLDGFILDGWLIDEPREGITRASHPSGEFHEGDGIRWRMLAETPSAIIGSIPRHVVDAANLAANPRLAYDIPVIFTVWGVDEDHAATLLRDGLGSSRVAAVLRTGRPLRETRSNPTPLTVDSWYLPNHSHIDGNDGDVYVEVKQR